VGIRPVGGHFAAVSSVGFEPVGQAFGAAVYPLIATAAVSCPGTEAPAPASRGPGTVTGWAGPGERIAQGSAYRAASPIR
jgi:hypothetical protein